MSVNTENGRKSEKPPVELSGKQKRFIREVLGIIQNFTELQFDTYASSITFFFFLSAIPMVVCFACLIPIFGVDEAAFTDFITQLTPSVASGLVSTVVSEAYAASSGVLPLSLIILVWSASQGTVALMKGLNRVYRVTEKRSYPIVAFTAVMYTVVILVMLGFLIAIIFSDSVTRILSGIFPFITVPDGVRTLLRFVEFFAVGTGFFAMIYKYIPSGSRRFVRQLPGALFASVAWVVFSFFFTLYLGSANRYSLFYGSLGTVAIMLFWLFCCFYILLVGGFINENIERRRRDKRIHRASYVKTYDRISGDTR